MSHGMGGEFGRAGSDDFESGSGMRASINELMNSRRAQVDELANATRDARGSDPQYDDIFLLRYVLSWEKRGGMTKAIDAIHQTIAWRKEHAAQLEEVVKPGGKTPNEDKIMTFETVGWAGSLAGLEPVYCVRTGHCNIKGLMQTFTVEQIVDWLHLSKERFFKICDERTRKTGRLIKTVTVIEMSNFSMFGGDKRFYKALGDASKLAAIMYPQLLGKTVLINTPSFFRAVFSTFSGIMPQSFLDKMAICPASGTHLANAPDARTCPFLSKYINGQWDGLITVLGGKMPMPQELLPRSDLDNGLHKITLANRSSTTVDIEVPSEGVTAKWEVIVQDFGVGMKATLYPDDGSTAMEVIPSMKIKAEGGLKEGLVLLPKRGKLQVTFDNTYSIFRSKTFDYRLSVIEDDVKKPVSNATVDQVAEQVRTVVHM